MQGKNLSRIHPFQRRTLRDQVNENAFQLPGASFHFSHSFSGFRGKQTYFKILFAGFFVCGLLTLTE